MAKRVDNNRYGGYNRLIELNKGNKKPSPQRFHFFCGLMADILLADTYMIAAFGALVKFYMRKEVISA